MPVTLDHMPAKKQPGDRHKPRRMTSIPERVAAALERIGDANESSLSEMVKRACIEFLEKRGEWPPPAPKGSKA